MERYGRYDLLTKLGLRGVAAVFLARVAGPMHVSRLVVLKRVLSDVSCEQEVKAMFVDEARLSMLLTHPNVVSTYEFGEEGGCYFLSMEWVDGHDARAVMRRC